MNSLITIHINFLTYIFKILFDVINALLEKFWFYFRKIDSNNFVNKNKKNKFIKFLKRFKPKIDNFLETKLKTLLDLLIKIAFIITGEKYTVTKGISSGLR
jgi:hypothetical protein